MPMVKLVRITGVPNQWDLDTIFDLAACDNRRAIDLNTVLALSIRLMIIVAS